MTCSKIRRKNRKVCIGDLNTEIKIQGRTILPPVFGNPDFNETFVDNSTVWAMVNTGGGKTFFDGVGTDINISHYVYIRFDSTVTAESWVELNSRRLDILVVEDLEERNEFMKLTCSDRGSNTLGATSA